MVKALRSWMMFMIRNLRVLIAKSMEIKLRRFYLQVFFCLTTFGQVKQKLLNFGLCWSTSWSNLTGYRALQNQGESGKTATPHTPPPPNFEQHAIQGVLFHNHEAKMVAKLPDDVIHRIKVRLDCGESIAQIRDATKVSKTALYRLRLNFDLFDQPYTPQSIVLGRPRVLLPAQELVIYTVI